MATLTKYQKDIRARVQRGHAYPAEEAFGLVKELAKAKFSESVDVAVNLGVDPRRSDQVVRGSTVLPTAPARTFALPCSPRASRPPPHRKPGRTSWEWRTSPRPYRAAN